MNTIFKSENTDTLIKLANKERLSNKNNWIFLELHYKNEITLVKSFGTSIQILKKNGINYPSGWDLKVSEWKNLILKTLNS
mgnify:CR=1 FL=1|jgi:hypothetical protein